MGDFLFLADGYNARTPKIHTPNTTIIPTVNSQPRRSRTNPALTISLSLIYPVE